MRSNIVRKLEMENKLLKEEIEELQDTKMIKSLTKSLERINRGKFITKKDLRI